MRGLAFALAAVVAAPVFAQAAPAPPAASKPKRICHWIETGNPLDNKRVCTTFAASQPAAPPAAPAEPAQVAMQAPQPHR